MDIDVSANGAMMVVSRAVFSGGSFPDSSKLALFDISSGQATAINDSTAILAQVNLPNCLVYAGSLSDDLKELYYTVAPSGGTPQASDLRVAVAQRSSTSDAFGAGKIIKGISGNLTEGPSISSNDGGKTLYFHKQDQASGKFKIYKVTRP